MKIKLLRHATVLLSLKGKNILIDPVFTASGVESTIPTKKIGRGKKNPLVDLPISKDDVKNIIKSLDAVLVTHMHPDHFSDAENLLPKEIPVLCQSEDKNKLEKLGFRQLIPLNMHTIWNGITITRVKCHHGGILIRTLMGKGTGYLLRSDSEPAVYISGDTIWSSYVKKTLINEKPDVVILYTGAAQLPFGRSITMGKTDILKVCKYAPDTRIIPVHMEAFNHCLLTRKKLSEIVTINEVQSRIDILDDGQCLEC
jgi:L-ascorbate metabolism protein UlaG (beta-lactamase superfamily)